MIEHNLTSENYFSAENNLKYMGVSQFKRFEECEALALAELKGEYERETTTALLVGSYVDAHFEGTLDIFQAKHPEIFTKQGTLKAEYKQAEYIIQRVERDKAFMAAMSGEKQKIMIGTIADVPFKIKIDSFLSDRIVDLKVMRDFKFMYKNECGKVNFIEAWGYDIQGAVYQEIVRQNIGVKLPFGLAAVTKEKESDLLLIDIPQDKLDAALALVEANVGRYNDLKHGISEPINCGHCDYCKFTKELNGFMSMEEFDLEYTD